MRKNSFYTEGPYLKLIRGNLNANIQLRQNGKPYSKQYNDNSMFFFMEEWWLWYCVWQYENNFTKWRKSNKVERTTSPNVENGLEDTGKGKGKLERSERVAWTYIHYQM